MQFDGYEYNPLPDETEPKHKYTIEIHRAMFTEEFFKVYKKYEKAVHNQDREESQVKRFLCNSPLYDDAKEP